MSRNLNKKWNTFLAFRVPDDYKLYTVQDHGYDNTIPSNLMLCCSKLQNKGLIFFIYVYIFVYI